MKKLLKYLLVLLVPVVAQAEFRELDFRDGPQKFRHGDYIRIHEVLGNEPALFRVGETLIVKGIYRLESRDEAEIVLVVAHKEDDDFTVQDYQKMRVTRGKGDFSLKIKIPVNGYLHVTYYPVGGGPPFGGIYFGTRQQMDHISHWSLDWYLEDSSDYKFR